MKKYNYLMVGGGMTSDAAVKGIREIDSKATIGVPIQIRRMIGHR